MCEKCRSIVCDLTEVNDASFGGTSMTQWRRPRSGRQAEFVGAMMSKLDVFEPAMCCATGVCGVDVDPALVQFSADLQWLAEHGVEVVRHGLGHDAAAFAANPEVIRELHAGMDRLPIATVDGRIISVGVYPSLAQLIQKLGLKIPAAEKPHIKAGACGCKPGEC